MTGDEKTCDVSVPYADNDSACVEGYLLDTLRNSFLGIQTKAAFRLGFLHVRKFLLYSLYKFRYGMS